MSWWQVEGVAGLEGLLAIADLEPELALEHIAPVRAGTAVVGQAPEQGRLVDVLVERHEVDGVPIDVLTSVHHRTVIPTLRGALLGYLRHLWSSFPVGARRAYLDVHGPRRLSLQPPPG